MSTRADDVTIEEVDITKLADEEIERIHRFGTILHTEAHPDDPPTPLDVTIAAIRNIPDFVGFRAFQALTSGGDLVGTATVQWLKTDENRHMAGGEIGVLPDHRRRSIGTRLLAELVASMRDEERTLLIGSTSDRVTAGGAFAERVGAEKASVGHINRLVLADVDRDLIARWLDEAQQRAPGYSVVQVDGRYPDDLIEQIVDLHHVMNTAPRDDLDIEDQNVTAEQIRAMEQMAEAIGSVNWYVAIRHDATGQLVGFTEMNWNPNRPKSIAQGGTAVRPEHRGHALGKWLKAINIDRALRERPEVEDIRTGNADSNDAMLGINHELGFKPYSEHVSWQVSVDKLQAYLDGR